MSVKIQVRRDLAAVWITKNPTLDSGEIGFETDTSKFKIGNGSSWNSTAYSTSWGNINGDISTQTDLQEELSKKVTKFGENILDIGSAVSGSYIDYQTGDEIVNASYSSSQYTALLPNTSYVLWIDSADKDVLAEQFALYNSDKTYVSGVSVLKQTVRFTTGPTEVFGRFTIRHANLGSNVMLEKGKKTSFSPYGRGSLAVADLNMSVGKAVDAHTTVTVGPTRDYETVREAVESITTASENNKFNILLDQGVWDVLGDYTQAEIDATSFLGVPIGDHISISGRSNKESTILVGYIAPESSSDTIRRVSTVSKSGSGGFFNLTITAENLRYAVHDDTSTKNTSRLVENCHFEKVYSASIIPGFSQAYGAGVWSGDRWKFKDTSFKSNHPDSWGFTVHNNINFDDNATIHFDNCDFQSISGKYCARFGSLASNTIEQVVFTNCSFGGMISIFEEGGTGQGINYSFTGGGNTGAKYEITDSTGGDVYLNFTDEVCNCGNNGSLLITKGNVVGISRSGDGSVYGYKDANPQGFYGVALEDIPVGSSGAVKYAGYLRTDDYNITPNMYDADNLIAGGYVDYLTGDIKVSANHSYLDYIELAPRTTYTISIESDDPTELLEQMAFYDASKVYVSGIIGFVRSYSFTTGATTMYLRTCYKNALLDKYYSINIGTLIPLVGCVGGLLALVDDVSKSVGRVESDIFIRLTDGPMGNYQVDGGSA